MGDGVEKRLIKPATHVVEALGLLTVILVSVFIVSLAIRALDALMGWNYHFVSIGDFLGAPGPHEKIFSWDRSFLLLGAAFGTGVVATWIQEFIDWARRSPEQRRRERNLRMEAVASQQQIKESEKQARLAAKRPMSGWRRLWIVMSILLGALTFALAYDSYDSAYADIAWTGDNEAFWAAAHANPKLSECDWSTAKPSEYTLGGYNTVYCDTEAPFVPAALWAFLPAVLMAAIGLTVRWIYRGFRSSNRSSIDQETGRDRQ